MAKKANGMEDLAKQIVAGIAKKGQGKTKKGNPYLCKKETLSFQHKGKTIKLALSAWVDAAQKAKKVEKKDESDPLSVLD